MLALHSLQIFVTEDRLRAELLAAERECESIVGRFDNLGRAPTDAEREARRLDFLASRKRLGALGTQLLQLRCPRT